MRPLLANRTPWMVPFGFPQSTAYQESNLPFGNQMFDSRSRIAIHVALMATALAAIGICLSKSSEAHERPNVLFIVVDDLRPELGCYGAAHVQSPNIDRLAKESTLFRRAYCQQAVCNPSRTSFMTGRRPDSIGVTGNHVHFRDRHPDVITIPQHFKSHGYHSQSIGKIYHGVFPDGASKTIWDTMGDPASWSIPTTRFGPRYYFTEEGIEQAKQAYVSMYQPTNPATDDWTQKLVFGPMTEAPAVDDDVLYDGKVADAAIEALEQFAEAAEQPFFLGVGFIKPHSPFVAPKKYFGLYDPAEIELSQQVDLPRNAPDMAGHSSGEVRRYTDQPKRGAFTEENQRRLKHAYYACISFIDAQIGRVLRKLKDEGLADNTIVVLVGDHGWHLGEHGLWGKTTNFELDTRVPLIVRTPAANDLARATDALTELVDLFPTLCELAELPHPDHLDGVSFVPVLNDPQTQVKDVAFSQYPRGGNADLGGRVMGYSVRNDRYRYTEWIERTTSKVVARELYDHEYDPNETISVAGEPNSRQAIQELSQRLHDELNLVAEEADDLQSTAIATGFEDFESGPFSTGSDASGSWHAEDGHVTIHTDHHRSGAKSLRLLGGEQRQVVWTLPPKEGSQTPAYDQLDLWFERWTRRRPFDFHIEVFSRGAWSTIHRDTEKAIVGPFQNHLLISLKTDAAEKIRFTSTTPQGSGVMLDDVQLNRPTPMVIRDVTARRFESPILVRNQINPVAELRIESTGRLSPKSLEEISVRVTSTGDLKDIETVEVFALTAEMDVPWRDIESLAQLATRFAEPSAAETEVSFKGQHELHAGDHRFLVSVKLRDNIDADHRIDVSVASVKIDGTVTKIDQSENQDGLRIGYAIRKAHDDDAVSFRIPGLVCSNQGTLVAVYDVRNRGWGDLPGDIDVGISRSTDGGRTWEPMQIIMDMGDDPKWNFDGIGDPAILVDRVTNTIWVAATWSHGNRSWNGSGPGLTPEETGQLMLVKSEDDGKTWSEPINITRQIKNPEWCFVLQGPGRGITMADGTLVFAAQFQDTEENQRLPRSTIMYSKDRGETWRIGSGAFDDTTEAQVVELEPGVLMLNCRYNRESNRVVMITRDMGQTWEEHATSRLALIEPRSCMASLIHAGHDLRQDDLDWLLFSNPDSTAARERTMIKASPDRGMTWPAGSRVMLDGERNAGYSCMAMIDSETVGILFEGSRAPMTFMRVPLREILGDAAPPEEGEQLNVLPRDDEPGQTGNSLSLPNAIGSHMVLQADRPILLWGQGVAGSQVTATLDTDTKSSDVSENGEWVVEFSPREASFNPIEVRIESGAESIVLTDVVIGDVWVCAGQSNMEWKVKQSDGANDASNLAEHRQIRLLNLVGAARGGSGVYNEEHRSRLSPELFCQGTWAIANDGSIPDFSAVGWYFALQLAMELDRPIGIINPSIGGTPTEAWISPHALDHSPRLHELVSMNWLNNPALGEWCRERARANLLPSITSGAKVPSDHLGPNHSFKPGFMWQAGIEPLLRLPIRGVIWYQGESNAESPAQVEQHRDLFELLVQDWRAQWRQPELPILFVQLPGMNRPDWPAFREQQRLLAQELDGVEMATTIDLGHPTNVHPTIKRPVGERLAGIALGKVYQREAYQACLGPEVRNAEFVGDVVRLRFEAFGAGLTSTDGAELRHFEIADDSQVFHPANAEIDGDYVVVQSERVKAPAFVRYAWIPYPEPDVNFANKFGLPASPFLIAKTR